MIFLIHLCQEHLNNQLYHYIKVPDYYKMKMLQPVDLLCEVEDKAGGLGNWQPRPACICTMPLNRADVATNKSSRAAANWQQHNMRI